MFFEIHVLSDRQDLRLRPGLPAGRVLVVDDDIRERSDLAEMVSALGFEVTTAGDGREALAIVKDAGFADAVHVGGGVLAWISQVDPSLPSY